MPILDPRSLLFNCGLDSMGVTSTTNAAPSNIFGGVDLGATLAKARFIHLINEGYFSLGNKFPNEVNLKIILVQIGRQMSILEHVLWTVKLPIESTKHDRASRRKFVGAKA